MVAMTHHSHLPTPLAHALHAAERVAGAILFTVLAPLSMAIAIVAGLVVAMGLARLF